MPTAFPRPPGSRSRRALLAGSAILLSCLPAVLVGEVLLRTLASDSWFVWPPNLRYEFHPSPEIMPGVSGVSRFEINGQGLRGDDFAEDQEVRLLALGGSTTECLYLDGTEAWPRLLQDLLDAGGKKVWVGNAGKSGLNTWHHGVQAEKLLAQYPKIDAVLVLAGVNDLSQRLALDRSYAPPAADKVTDEAFEQKPLRFMPGPFYKRTALWQGLKKIDRRLRTAGTSQDPTGRVYATWRRRRQDASVKRTELPDLGPALEDYAGNLRAIADTAARHGARVVFMTQPALWREDLPEDLERLLWMGGVGRFQQESGHEYYSAGALAAGMAAYNRTLLEVCREIPGAICVDLAARLSQDTTAVFYDDVPFNEAGSRRVARGVAEGVQGAGG
ncbi:MAG TPA: SGNH/GDSL hydrolase family protein, partial [Thermoanaerobaculia bacterium]|nr:SGNH/GDSL hydrolase family protein [Thermoanaerobaculia bacterium]